MDSAAYPINVKNFLYRKLIPNCLLLSLTATKIKICASKELLGRNATTLQNILTARKVINPLKALVILFVILTYDIASPKRLPKILKTCRMFLFWIQNSVFEGNLTESQLKELISKIELIINKKEDSVFIYAFRDKSLANKKVIGVEKNEFNFII
jgi:CRISPR-associated protein Cas2